MLLLRTGNAKEYEELSARDIAKRFGVPIEKLVKTPVFELVPDKIHSKPGQSKEISGPAGASPPASFTFKHERVTYELRYATSNFPQEKGDKFIDVYEPRKIKFLGIIQFVDPEDEDLLVYMFLYPWCGNSPFKAEAVSQPHWYFKDVEKLADADVDKFAKLGEAITTISRYSGEPLRIVAKGFDIIGTEQLIDSQIQSQLLTIAQSDPAAFLTKINSQLTTFRGIAVNAIDTGLFIIKGAGNGKAWFWNRGEQNGKKITEIYDNGIADAEQLLTYVNANIHEYYPLLFQALQSEKSVSTAEKFLSAQAPIDLMSMFDNTPKSVAQVDTSSDFGGGTDDIEVKDNFVEQEVFPAPPVTEPRTTPHVEPEVPVVPDQPLPPVVETAVPPVAETPPPANVPAFLNKPKGAGK